MHLMREQSLLARLVNIPLAVDLAEFLPTVIWRRKFSLWRWTWRISAKSAAKGTLAENPSLWRIICPFGGGFGGESLPLAVDLAENIPFGGGDGNSLPTVGGKETLGCDLFRQLKSANPDFPDVRLKNNIFS